MTKKTTKTTSNQALRAIDAPFYRYWQALYFSFFSGRLYIDVGKRWKGLGLRYLLLLIVIMSIPLSVRLAFDFNRFYDAEIVTPLNKIPTLYIQNGLLSLDKPMPYLIRNKAGEVVLIIDTSGTVNNIDEKYPHLTMLLTQKSFFYRFPNADGPRGVKESTAVSDKIYTQEFGSNMNQVFNGKEWLKSANITWLKWGAELIFYPMVIALFYTLYTIFFLVCTFLSQMFAKLFVKATLTYQQTCRLFIVSSTPSVVLLLSAVTLNYQGSIAGIMVIALMVLYYCFAVATYKHESNQLVRY